MACDTRVNTNHVTEVAVDFKDAVEAEEEAEDEVEDAVEEEVEDTARRNQRN